MGDKARISLQEFLLTSNESPEHKAGFKAYVGGIRLAYPEEWEELLTAFKSR